MGVADEELGGARFPRRFDGGEYFLSHPLPSALVLESGGSQVIPEAASVYITITLLLEFYRSIFRLDGTSPAAAQNFVARFSLIPDFDGKLAKLLKLFFVDLRGTDPTAAAYTEDQIRRIIAELNELYEGHPGDKAGAARATSASSA